MVSPLYLLLALPPPHWKGSCLLQQHGIQLVTRALLARAATSSENRQLIWQ